MAEWCAAIIEWQYYGGDQHILSVRERMRYALSNWGTHMLKSPRKDADGYPHSVYMLALRERGHHWTHLDSQFPFYVLYSDEGKWYWMKPHISNCHYLFIFAFLSIHATGPYWSHNAATLKDSAGISLFESAIKCDHLQMLTRLLDDGGEIPGNVLERVEQRSLPGCSQRATELIDNYLASRTPVPKPVIEPPPRWTVPFLKPIIQRFRWFIG